MIFVHLLNDASGSPRVLESVISAIGRRSNDKLYLGSGGNGPLQHVGIPVARFPYHRSRFRLITLTTYLLSQITLFLGLLIRKENKSHSLIYINTALPFAAAIYGRLFGMRVVYHLHEVSIAPRLLQSFLWSIVKLTADEVRYVSEFHRESVNLGSQESKVVYNAVREEFSPDIKPNKSDIGDQPFKVYMLASARDYKGIPEFITLAKNTINVEAVTYHLVLNDEPAATEAYIRSIGSTPSNVDVLSRSIDVLGFYKDADVVLNLSRPSEWVETFGMTLLEAMACGVPVICPTVGGPVEVLGEDLAEFCIDGTDTSALAQMIQKLASQSEFYSDVSQRCLARAAHFSWANFEQAVKS